ncbi:MAG: LiaF domain-containing protein [Minisyncoccia bacterium]
MGGIIVGIILILIGISALTGIPFFGFLFAIVLIAIGVRMIARRSVHSGWRWDDYDHDHDHNHTHKTASGERSIDEVAIFSPLNKSYTAEHFKGGKIVMVFSGGEVNLTQIKTDETEIHLEVSSIFSGIEIVVPKDWKVKSSANVFLGNVDTSAAQGGDGTTTLIIHGEAVFGEIEVRKQK